MFGGGKCWVMGAQEKRAEEVEKWQSERANHPTRKACAKCVSTSLEALS